MLVDFCGFTFNGIHSSELNIIRVSNGSRYNENLSAAFQDKTAQIEGGDGVLFWDSYYTNRPFSIQIAYDSLTEMQLRKLRQVFSPKAIGELIFDETPYKAYTVKVQSPVQLTHLCFNDKDGNRIYKGEGTIQLIAYYPYAKSVHKFLDEYSDFFYNNKNEWAEASGLAPTQGSYDGTGESIPVYNPGDIEADWQAFYSMTDAGCGLTQIRLQNTDTTYREEIMNFTAIPRKGTDAFLCLSSRTQLLEGCDSNYNSTGTLYNEFFISGEFFKIPLGKYNFVSNTSCAKIKYNYLYY